MKSTKARQAGRPGAGVAFLVVLTGLIGWEAAAADHALTPVGLRCEFADTPLGVGALAASIHAAETWTDVSSPWLARLTNSGAALAWPGGCSGVVVNRLSGEATIKVVGRDGGMVWRRLAIHLNANRDRISMVGALAGTTFIYSKGEGIERSTDTGATWAKVAAVNPQTRVPVLFGGTHYLGTGSGLLVSVVLPDSVTSMGEMTFSNCYGLASVATGNGVTSIGERAFMGCSLVRAAIPSGRAIPSASTASAGRDLRRRTRLTKRCDGGGCPRRSWPRPGAAVASGSRIRCLLY